MIALWWTYFVGLLGILLTLLYKYSTRKFGYWKLRNVPEIKPIPFVGSILPVLLTKIPTGQWLWNYYNKIDADFFGIYVFDRPVLVLKSAKLVKAVLQKDFDNFDDRTLTVHTEDPVMNHVLFFKRNPEWRRERVKVTPIFTSGKLKAMYPLILHETEQMTEYIKKHANVPNVDGKEVSAKYSTNVISKCAFAIDAGSFQNDNAEIRNLTKQIFGFRASTALRQFGSFFLPNFMKKFKIQFFHPDTLRSCKRILGEVLQLRKQSKTSNGADLIDLLIETNKKSDDQFFTDDAMVGHALQFLIAGFETVSNSLSFALYEMAVNPDMQERLRAEIQENVERDNGISYTAIPGMKYLDMVVCEALRKYPVLPFLDRMCKSDYKVEGTDFVIEKGTPVYIPMFGLHYDTKYFPEPEKYDPERFAEKSWVNKDGTFYIPFGEGPRICLGERFGMLGVKLGLISILLKFKLEKSSKTPIPIEFEPKSLVLQSKIGIPITFVPL